MQRAGHAAHRHPAGAVGGHARRLWSGRAAARPPTAALACRPEPATGLTLNITLYKRFSGYKNTNEKQILISLFSIYL